MRIRGSCHCGNIAFELDWEPDPVEIPARACSCSFCVRHGGLWTSAPGGSLVVKVTDPWRVSTYAFETHTAEFHVCARCGVVPVVTSRIDDRVHAVVSVNAMVDVDSALIRRMPASFDGESRESRLVRRQKNWIADVSFTEGPG